jgi:Domain of unknown function (DUF1851)
MISQLVQELRGLKDVAFRRGADTPLFARFETENRLVLPSEHQELLRSSNGIEAYAGYVRLFGLYTMEGIDSVLWNQPDYWKFAWENRCSAYWCFGETAWGDQYAYAVEALRGGTDAKVYFIDALSMTAEVVATSFTDFLQNEFLRSAKDPYDDMIKRARQKLGQLEVTSHLVYFPPLLLGGTEEIANVQKMNARSAMICNGDFALQLDEGPATGRVTAVETYEDAKHRTRLRLLWE